MESRSSSFQSTKTAFAIAVAGQPALAQSPSGTDIEALWKQAEEDFRAQRYSEALAAGERVVQAMGIAEAAKRSPDSVPKGAQLRHGRVRQLETNPVLAIIGRHRQAGTALGAVRLDWKARCKS